MNTFYRNSTNTDTALFALCIDYSLDKPILFASDVCIFTYKASQVILDYLKALTPIKIIKELYISYSV